MTDISRCTVKIIKDTMEYTQFLKKAYFFYSTCTRLIILMVAFVIDILYGTKLIYIYLYDVYLLNKSFM